MSKLKRLIEAANRKCEMAWKVYSYNPEKDNELVDTSKAFDCIAAAQAHKREILEKNPNYTVEIVAESSQKNEGKKVRDINEVPENTAVATAWNNGDGTYKIVVFANKKGKLSDNDTDKFLDKKLFKSHKAAVNYALSKGYYVQSFESANIDVKNPGVLEVPDGKKVNELPQSHFEKLVDKKGYAEVIRALTNLEVWNKDKNKSLSSWASSMADKLKKKFRPESSCKNESLDLSKLSNDDAIKLAKYFNDFAKDKTMRYDLIDKIEDILKKKYKAESAQKLTVAKAMAKNNISKDKRIINMINALEKDIQNAKTNKERKELQELLAKLKKKAKIESAQMNETRGYTVIAELSVPDNMNNRDIEDEVEKLLRASNKINVVMDVTAERK